MLTDMEIKFIRLALDPAAQIGEIQNASIMFFNSLRKRGITAEGFGLGKPQPQPQQQTKKPPNRRIMPFGKHSGKEFDDIEPQYLRWVYNKWIPGLDDEGQKSWKWLALSIEDYFGETGEHL